MAEENRIEDIERVDISGDGDGGAAAAEDNEAEAGDGDSSEEEGQSTEKIVHKKPEKTAGKEEDKDGEGEVAAEGNDEDGGGDGSGEDSKPVEGETPRERALRLETSRLRTELRKKQTGELGLGKENTAPAKKELSDRSKEILGKYKPEEINALREVIPALAEEMGFVRAEELTAQQYNEQSQDILDEFLEKHPEYTPEKDKDGILWGRFKEEFNRYKPPQNPKDYRKLFNKIHSEVFGIRPATDKGPIAAAQRKIQVASHAGASGPSRQVITPGRKANVQGLRVDMLKGFSDEEKAAMTGSGDED